MKLRDILAQFTLIIIVKGTFLAAAVQPFILGLGAILSAVDLDSLDIQPIEWNNLLPFVNKQEKT